MRENNVTMIIKKLGGVGKLANALNVKRQMVQQWRNAGKFPTKKLREFEELTGIPRHELAPDLFEGYVRVESKTEENKEEAS